MGVGREGSRADVNGLHPLQGDPTTCNSPSTGVAWERQTGPLPEEQDRRPLQPAPPDDRGGTSGLPGPRRARLASGSNVPHPIPAQSLRSLSAHLMAEARKAGRLGRLPSVLSVGTMQGLGPQLCLVPMPRPCQPQSTALEPRPAGAML